MISYGLSFFPTPHSLIIENIILFHDHVVMFLFSVLVMVLFFLISITLTTDFDLNVFDHHQLEFLWTISPFFLLLMIVIPSINLLYFSDSCLFCGLTVYVVGHQWYWRYSVKDFFKFSFDSYILPSDSSSVRLLDVDNRLVIPFNLPLRFFCSSGDVIHSWTVPSVGVKMDAVPGRVNQFCFSLKHCGVFFGQCSEICGANHSFMPIVMESVSLKDFYNSFFLRSLIQGSCFLSKL